MILAFTTHVKDRPTGFVEKINDGIKIHTFREDVNNRWREGMPIQFATGVRTKKYNHFKDGRCTGVQKIEIKHFYDGILSWYRIYVDGRLLAGDEVERLVKNDGFDSQLDFYNWFNKDFTGKIIHWTDLRY